MNSATFTRKVNNAYGNEEDDIVNMRCSEGLEGVQIAGVVRRLLGTNFV